MLDYKKLNKNLAEFLKSQTPEDLARWLLMDQLRMKKTIFFMDEFRKMKKQSAKVADDIEARATRYAALVALQNDLTHEQEKQLRLAYIMGAKENRIKRNAIN